MKKIIIFNWKSNLPILSEWKEAIKSSTPPLFKKEWGGVELVVCPPFTHIKEIRKLLPPKIKLAAQNVFWENNGPYTGEISAEMLKNLGVEYVIVGHSERRRILGETDEMINRKVKAALKAGLKVVLCVGEELFVRRRGKKAVENFIKKQLEKDLKGIRNLKPKTQNLIVAYEPVWAIGTGNPCRPEDALKMIKFIKQTIMASGHTLSHKVLYGGSVDGKNIRNFVELKEIDGVLVGGASLKKEEIKKIINNFQF